MGSGVSSFCNRVVEVGKKIGNFFKSAVSWVVNGLKNVGSLLKGLFASKANAQEITDVSNRLRNAEKSLNLMRTDLESLANETISKVDQLIGVLQTLNDGTSKERIKNVTNYAASRMISLVDRSVDKLAEFKEKYAAMNRDMSDLKTELDRLSWKMDGAQRNKINVLIEKVDMTENNILDELKLLTDWKRRLHEMQPDFDSLDEFAFSVEVNKSGVVMMLVNLKDACNTYIQAGQ